ncbi:MAG: calcium-binding protein, partial [Planctomycetaceae bacterium]
GAGDDTIQGGAGNDVTFISSDDGNDVVQASNGNDQTVIDTGDLAVDASIAAAGDSAEVVVTGGANFTVQTQSSRIFLRTGGEADTVDIDAIASVGVSEVRVQTSDGNDTIDGEDTDVRLLANGGGGSDMILGGSGNDELRGASGRDSIVGAAGSDLIRAGNGADIITSGGARDVIVAGNGADDVSAGADDDIVVAGTTGLSLSDLRLIQAEWQSGRDYATRVANVTGTGSGERENGNAFLSVEDGSETAFDDAQVDELTGANGLDLFFANPDLDVSDLNTGEELFDLR